MKTRVALALLVLFVACVGFSMGSRSELPSSWKTIDMPGVDEAWQKIDEPEQIITVVRMKLEGPTSFRGQSHDSIASGLIAMRETTLKEFGINDWAARTFNYEDHGDCERVDFTGSFTRPDGGHVQFVEHDIFRDGQMIQNSRLIEQEATPSDETSTHALLGTLDHCG